MLLRAKIPSRTTSPEHKMWGGAPDRLKSLITSTAYDQTVALDAPVFDPSATVKLVPYRDVAVDGFMLGSRKLGALSFYAAGLAQVMRGASRFEPLNQTAIHRSYPSPRSLYPVSVRLVCANETGERRFGYDPEHHAMVGDFVSLEPGTYSLHLEIAGDLDRISPLYGNLGPTLCALESGHLLRQVHDALAQLGEIVACSLSSSEMATRELSVEPEGGHAFPIATMRIDNCDFTWSTAELSEIVRLRVSSPLLTRTDRQRVAAAVRHLDCAASPAEDISFADDINLNETLASNAEKGRLRTSGHFPWGIFGEAIDDSDRQRMVKACSDAFRQFHSAWYGHRIDGHLLMPTAGGGVEMLNLADGKPVPYQKPHWQRLADAFGSSFNIDLQTIPAFLVFSTPFAEFVNGPSGWPYVQTMCAAGAIAQRVCVDATNLGFFARPFKGLIAKNLESSFAIDGQVFYSVILGRRLVQQPFYSLSGMEWP